MAPQSGPSKDPKGGSLRWGAGAAVLMVICCAGPVLIAAGALTGIGGLLRNPWVIGAGLVLVLGAVLIAIQRHRKRDRNNC